jgi:hypothetical protein
MATRQEELKYLQDIQDALSSIRHSEQEIEKKTAQLRKQFTREIPPLPKYTPECTLKEATENAQLAAIKKYSASYAKNKKLRMLAFILTALCELIFLVVGVFAFEINASLILSWIAAFGISFALYAIPHVGMIIAAVLNLLLFFAFNPYINATSVSDSRSSRDMLIFSILCLVFAIMTAIIYIVWRIVDTKLDKKRSLFEQQSIASYKDQEEKRRQEYEDKKRAAEEERQREMLALSREVEKTKRTLYDEIDKAKKSLDEKKRVLAQLPGLAEQDKNLNTVSTLINYFERGKADSIKEAINLFDQEERERLREEARISRERTDRFIADMERKAALDRMEREQYSHNQAMRDSARRMEQEQKSHNEKIQKELDDLKNGR